MSGVDLLKSIAEGYGISKKFEELEIGDYKIKCFELVKTKKFGVRLIVRMEDFFVWLPPRFSDKINSNQLLVDMNKKASENNFYMRYNGKDIDQHGKILLDFIEKENK